MMPPILMKNCLFPTTLFRRATHVETVKSAAHRQPILALVCALLLAPLAAAHAADPFDELAALSSLPKDKLDRAKLEKGETVWVRSPGMNFQRGQCIESAFVVEAPVEKTLESLREWNVTAHPDLKVYLHTDIPGAPGPADFSKLASAPSNSAVKSLVAATSKLGSGSSELQLSSSDLEGAPKKGDGKGVMTPEIVSFWTGVLERRSRAFAGGGAPALPPYNIGDQKIAPGAELSSLLATQPKIRNQFKSIIETVGASGKPSKPSLYWEMLDSQGQASLNLGASVFSSPGKTAQAADLQYYSSNSYFVYLTVYQMWGIQVGSKPATLIWRADLISSGELANLHGIERNASGAALGKEIDKLNSYFQKDTR